MTTSVSLRKVLVGTEIKNFQEGITSVIPVEMCYLGCQESLDKLTRLAEPEIPDAILINIIFNKNRYSKYFQHSGFYFEVNM